MSNDLAAINQTLASYCHRVDRGTADEVAALFAQDAILSPYYDGRYDVYGRDAIRSWYALYHQTLGASVKHLKHLIHSVMIDIDGDAASSVCYLTAYFIGKENNKAYQVQGTYYDTLIRQGQEWLFQNRRIEVEFLTPLGDVIDRMQPMGFGGAAH
jgi:ketosteroid isomerase-like protein